MSGIKHDKGKLPWALSPWDALGATMKVLAFGATKYGDRNWEAGMAWSRPFAASIRHLTALWNGEDMDPESGLPHLAHAACNVLFLLAYQLRRVGVDDRPGAAPIASPGQADAWTQAGWDEWAGYPTRAPTAAPERETTMCVVADNGIPGQAPTLATPSVPYSPEQAGHPSNICANIPNPYRYAGRDLDGPCSCITPDFCGKCA